MKHIQELHEQEAINKISEAVSPIINNAILKKDRAMIQKALDVALPISLELYNKYYADRFEEKKETLEELNKKYRSTKKMYSFDTIYQDIQVVKRIFVSMTGKGYFADDTISFIQSIEAVRNLASQEEKMDMVKWMVSNWESIKNDTITKNPTKLDDLLSRLKEHEDDPEEVDHILDEIIQNEKSMLESMGKIDYNRYTIPLTKKETTTIFQKLTEQEPSDVVVLNEKTVESITNVWRDNKSWKDYWYTDPSGRVTCTIPDDLLKTGQLPMEDFCLDFTAFSDTISKKIIRVMIFSDYEDRITQAMENQDSDYVVVGSVSETINFKGQEVEAVQGIVVHPKTSCIHLTNVKVSDKITEERHRQINELFYARFQSSLEETVTQTTKYVMPIWYGIEVCLLHPVIKEVFADPNRVKRNKYKEKEINPNKVNKVKYVKIHLLENKDFNTDLEYVVQEADGKSYVRKTMAWYVIGHKRTYRNGKIITVKPYWKGPWRELKKVSPAPIREREIVVPPTIEKAD